LRVGAPRIANQGAADPLGGSACPGRPAGVLAASADKLGASSARCFSIHAIALEGAARGLSRTAATSRQAKNLWLDCAVTKRPRI